MILGDPRTEQTGPWARGRTVLGTASSGVWSVVEDLYSQIGRTLSTNWNLKFQREKKKKRAEGTFACVEMTTLVTFPWDFCSLSCNLGFLLALKWRWAEQGPERAQGFAALQSFTPEPISASCACGGKKKKCHVKYCSSTVALGLRVPWEQSSGGSAARASDGIARES